MKTSSKPAQRILVVEDERVIAVICRRVLASEGFEVDIAANGKTAQHMVKTNHYDYCMIDVKMPVMNGDDFYRWLQEERPSLANRVIFTTGDVIGKGTGTFLEQSGKPFLPKPFTPDELKGLVRQVVMGCQCLA